MMSILTLIFILVIICIFWIHIRSEEIGASNFVDLDSDQVQNFADNGNCEHEDQQNNNYLKRQSQCGKLSRYRLKKAVNTT